jgi:predicted DCC family thiol-disulfide oxidoreductase YuxK
MSEKKPAITVYYNSACPVCDAGIRSQKERMAACAVAWKDVHTDTAARGEMTAELEFVRKRLHAVDEQGRVQVGIDAAITIWRHSPGEAWKAWLFSLPLLRSWPALPTIFLRRCSIAGICARGIGAAERPAAAIRIIF